MLTTTTTPHPIAHKFQDLIKRDRPLRNAIAFYQILPTTLRIKAAPGGKGWLYKKLGRIVRLFLLCGYPLESISIDGASFNTKTLTELEPALIVTKLGAADRGLSMAIARQHRRRFNAMLSLHAKQGSVFVISLDGVYRDVEIKAGTESKIPPAEMIGRSLFDVLPCQATAGYILTQIRECYATGEERTIEYGLWDRRYESDLTPVMGEEEVLVLCRRTA